VPADRELQSGVLRREQRQRGGRLNRRCRAQAIQRSQALRRTAGQARPYKTKAYWSLGKAGLD
jgi:hypothetical protein